ncbi:UDP-N-acetylmuramoyl-L-alanyl-D-glutamate--2,6-diaminopimelate ligase [Edaphobacillus lindanitolerans]|uniref:UDP-N-acetylmuramyl-tripeptide synthetase n=1 Tax=Edaphobacillus lindanitolerans TaxID=550447 RepID=A0A1U7PM31_9BACI|nr:UDP-N-acetylmuramoyl-L-alanyl-D-glutamate--2,6-diaminopimelate ligase [Edaphobacillus lindanitolerans]SIT68512.1 UDP-N-acetylmuramoylalanyl-D-glutamate--2,6-diaminopimelate ligase [Edaphobacillus lindanitolerans]
METKKLLEQLPVKKVTGTLPAEVTDLTVDSRAVQPGGAFICISGYTVDGHDYAGRALEAGARVIIAERPVDIDPERAALVLVDDTARAEGLLAAEFYGHPSRAIRLIGVTGTNGKTSVTGIIHGILRSAGRKSAASGTIGFDLDGTLYESANTTTDAITTQQMIRQAVIEGCDTMTMEVSSHGLVEGRLSGTEFDIAVFTNLTHDHLDFHGTMDHYGYAKGLLFSQLGQDTSQKKAAVLNIDDPWSERYRQMTPFPVYSYGLAEGAMFRASGINLEADSTSFTMETPEGQFAVKMNLLGEFNVHNALAATAALHASGMPIGEILDGLAMLPPVKGRMEKVQADLPVTMYIDYAHTPDAIEKAIDSVLPYKKNKLIFLIGTGGNRDRSKRPTMAEKASVADYVVLTTDDPRDEPYDSITSELAAGMKHGQFACIGDRAEAVRHAAAVAEEGDIIIFAGKGHEDYQIIGRTKYPHSDAAIAIEELERKFGRKAGVRK